MNESDMMCGRPTDLRRVRRRMSENLPPSDPHAIERGVAYLLEKLTA
jgi:hypothetical protein